MKLVSTFQARDHLRSDTDADDADLCTKIEAASEMVVDYLGDFAETFLERDSAGDLIEYPDGVVEGVPARVQQATLVTIAWLYRERDGSNEHAVDAQFGYGYTLPKGATAILYSLRPPTVI